MHNASPPPQLFVANQQNGFVTLMATLFVGTMGVAIAVSLLLFALSTARSSGADQESAQARALANACAEYALTRFQQSATYAGSENLTLPSGTCSIAALGGSGPTNRTIQATGTAGSAVRKVRVVISQREPSIQLTSWEEVADF